jgi:flagellar biosynthesis/type III secretory pathway protein FliH
MRLLSSSMQRKKKSIEKGRKEGKEEGLQEGMEKGKEVGIQEGKLAEREQLVRGMHKNGMDIEDILQSLRIWNCRIYDIFWDKKDTPILCDRCIFLLSDFY